MLSGTSMMRLSGTEGTDGVEETPGHRVPHCKAATCKDRLSHRNRSATRDITGNYHDAQLDVCVYTHR